jgi:hypothetical protein
VTGLFKRLKSAWIFSDSRRLIFAVVREDLLLLLATSLRILPQVQLQEVGLLLRDA